MPQLVRMVPNFRDEGAWYDSVVYRVGDSLRAGEVRAIVSCVNGDMTLTSPLAASDAVAGCPLT